MTVDRDSGGPYNQEMGAVSATDAGVSGNQRIK